MKRGVHANVPRRIFASGWETEMLWVLWEIPLPSSVGVSPITTARLRWRKQADILQPFSDHNSLFQLLAMTLNSGDQCGKGGGPVSSNCWSSFLSLGLALWLTHTWCIKMSSFLSRKSMVYVPEPVATLGQLPYWLPATVSALEVFPSHFCKVCC